LLDRPEVERRPGFERLLPAFLKDIAIACFCGLPERTSSEMFREITFFELPRLRGIEKVLLKLVDDAHDFRLVGVFRHVLPHLVSDFETVSGGKQRNGLNELVERVPDFMSLHRCTA
jgi:hypothetical protein